MLLRALVVALPVALAAGPAVLAPQGNARPSRDDARRLQQKVSLIVYHGNRSDAGPLRTTITERELNAYLALDARADLPAGVMSPSLVIHGDRRVAGTAVVDLDAVRAQHKSTGMLDPMNFLTGRLPVAASGLLDAANGMARVQLESASVAGVPVPLAVLREVVAYYTRSPEYPRGVDIDEPFPLPARIKAIDVRRGEAVVVQ
jgi:hypothetical protein